MKTRIQSQPERSIYPVRYDSIASWRLGRAQVNLKTAVGKDREPCEPREKKGDKRNPSAQKHFTQQVNRNSSPAVCPFVYSAYFAVSNAFFRVNRASPPASVQENQNKDCFEKLKSLFENCSVSHPG